VEQAFMPAISSIQETASAAEVRVFYPERRGAEKKNVNECKGDLLPIRKKTAQSQGHRAAKASSRFRL
jgi:hypothetical protein